jgi:hypothetical protein
MIPDVYLVNKQSEGERGCGVEQIANSKYNINHSKRTANAQSHTSEAA